MFDAQLWAFVGIAAMLTITPGADTMLVMRNVLARGPRAGVLTALGICCGLFVHALLSGVGLSLILVRSVMVFEVIKFAGAAYLLFLGAQSVWHGLRGVEARAVEHTSDAAASYRRAFGEGLLTNVLNPKVAIFYLAFLPQFITSNDSALLRSIELASMHWILGILWFSLIAMMLGRMRLYLTQPHIQRRLETCTGAILIAFGLRLALERR